MTSALRNKLRESIFADKNKKIDSRPLKLFGENVEVRQPTLAQITKLSKLSTENSKVPPIVRIMIEYIYVPGTDDKVFETADAESLAAMPSGQWLTDLNKVLEELTSVDVQVAEKNSEETD